MVWLLVRRRDRRGRARVWVLSLRRRIIRRQLESSIETKVVEDAKEKLGVLSIKLELKRDDGWPDREFLIPGGKPLFIEFKRGGEDLRALQDLRAKVLRALGYDVIRCDDYDDAMNAVKERLCRSRGNPMPVKRRR